MQQPCHGPPCPCTYSSHGSQKQPFKTKANPDFCPQKSPVISYLTWSQSGNSYQRLQSSCVIWPPPRLPSLATPPQHRTFLLSLHIRAQPSPDPGPLYVTYCFLGCSFPRHVHSSLFHFLRSLLKAYFIGEIVPDYLTKYCLHPHMPTHPYPATRGRTWWKIFQIPCL